MLINGASYKIVVGFDAPSDPKEETVIHLTMMDGSTTTIDFGARLTSTANITIVELTKQQFIDLTEYILANVGSKVLFTRENEHENLFVDNYGGGIGSDEYYVYPLKADTLQEEDFSVTRELFTLKIEIALAGFEEEDVPNPEDTSLIDILIEIDTLNGALRDIDPPNLPQDGGLWFHTDTNLLQIYNGLTDAWEDLYTVAPDDPTVGFYQGTFYLSTFSTLTTDDNTYIAGLINYKAVQLPGQNLDISKGSSIARKDGFSFSVSNHDRFWKFIIDNEIALFNVTCSCYVYTDATRKKLLTGRNQTNSFTYSDYKFVVEPFLLNFRENFPSNVIGDNPDVTGERYDNIKVDMIGKAPYKTFGDHAKAALQNISTINSDIGLFSATVPKILSEPVPTPKFPEQFSIFARIYYLDQTKIYIPKTRTGYSISSSDNNPIVYSITSDQITALENNHVVKIISDTFVGSENVDVSRKILSVSDSDPDWIIITLVESFPTTITVDDSQYIYLRGATYQFQIDDLPCSGFGSYDNNGEIVDTIVLYAIDKGNNRDLVPIPSSDFAQNNDGNIVFVSVETATDSTSVDTYTTTSSLIPAPINKRFQGVSDTELDKDQMNVTLGTSLLDNFKRLTFSSGESIPTFYSFFSTNGFTDRMFRYRDKLALFDNAPYYLSQIGITSTYTNESFVNLFSFPVSHVYDNLFINNDNVRLGLDLLILSYFHSYRRATPTGYIFTSPASFYVTIRFRTNAGTYIDNSDWKLPIVNPTMLGLTNPITPLLPTQWGVNITNMPNGETGGFSVNPPALDDNWSADTSDISFIVQYRAIDEAFLPGIIPFPYNPFDKYKGVMGTQMWYENSAATSYNGLYETDTGLDGFGDRVYFWRKCVTQPVIGDKILVSLTDTSNGTITDNKVYEVTSTSPYSATIVSTNSGIQTLKGRDLFDLNASNLIGGSSPVWGSIVAMELLITCTDVVNNQYIKNSGVSAYSTDNLWTNSIRIKQAPTIFFFKEMELIDVPLFSQVLGEGSYTLASDVVPAILEQSQLSGRYDTTSLSEVFSGDVVRSALSFRRQFTSAMNLEAMLLEILKNLWLVAVINEDDKLEFRKLEATSGSPIFAFDETNIIDNSISEIKFRRMTEIYQKFRLNFKYFIPSEFSKAISKWDDSEFIDKNNGNAELTTLIRQWSQIYNMNNEMFYDLIYHYEDLPKEFITWIVNFFVGNSWTFSFRTPMTNVYNGTGIKLMDVVSVDTYFHTSNQVVNGFVVGINPDLYEGVVELEIYVVDPPGKYGVICNPFNDALDVGTRDISGWTELNGRQNDAGDVSTDRSAYGEKDAGNVATRTLKC